MDSFFNHGRVCWKQFGSLSQTQERVINQILSGQLNNDSVTVNGVVVRLDTKPAQNTVSYVLRDDWDDEVTVVSEQGHPETGERYIVQGVVNYDNSVNENIIIETNRRLAMQESPPPVQESQQITSTQQEPENAIDIYLILLIVAVVAVLIVLTVLLVRKSGGEAQPQPIDPSSVVSVDDKTIKTVAPTEKAIQQGTVKVMPGRFEVSEGSDLQEIRLIRPPGAAEHEIKYTFGRKSGDKFKHIQLNDTTVSSRQAELLFRNGKYVLVNIPDPNDPDRYATLVNGEKMQAQENRTLSEGDVIQMGHVVLIYHS